VLAALLSVACVESVSHPFEDFVIEVEPAKLRERCRSRRASFIHDTSGDSTSIASQARISSDARPQSATIAEAFVAGLAASKAENAASSSVSSSWNRRSSAAAPSSAFARS